MMKVIETRPVLFLFYSPMQDAVLQAHLPARLRGSQSMFQTLDGRLVPVTETSLTSEPDISSRQLYPDLVYMGRGRFAHHSIAPAREWRRNPPETKIYERAKEIVAVKGPGHLCDAACKRAGHTYRHRFSKKYRVGVYGAPNKKKITLH